MGRRPVHSAERIVAAASELVAADGVKAATIASIAERMGAPTGSIYHRFPSRDVILARVWLDAVEAFQRGLLELLGNARTLDDGLAAALHVPRWVASHPVESRILLWYRREDLMGQGLPRALTQRARTVNEDIERTLRKFASRAVADRSRDALRRLTFALVDAPLAAVRPHIKGGEKPPGIVNELVETTYRAVTSGLAPRAGSS